MNRKITWKLAVFAVLVALILPVFTVLSPLTADATEIAPLPWAMEAYGQRHRGIYKAQKAPVLDGTLDEDVYVLMDSLGSDNDNNSGIFSSLTEDGSSIAEPASEYRPHNLIYWAAYDSQAIYFYIEANTRLSSNGYAIDAKLGFDFSPRQDATVQGQEFSFALPAGQSQASGTGYSISSRAGKDITNMEGTHQTIIVSYEFSIRWEDVVSGKAPETDFDRLYLTTTLRYFSGSEDLYWIYGIPNNIALPTGQTVGAAFQEEFSAAGVYTPNVLELLGEKGDQTLNSPQVFEITRPNKESETGAARKFEAGATLTLPEGVNTAQIREAGMLLAQTKTVGNRNLTVTGVGEKLVATGFTGTDAYNYKVSFSTTSSEYKTFFSLRPYVEYADGTVVYGDYYTTSPFYYDEADREYQDSYKVLMIGDSMCYYYLDELVQIANADGIYMLASNVYESGCDINEHWTWFLKDYTKESEKIYEFYTFTPDKSKTKENTVTLKHCLKAQDWGYISMQNDVYHSATNWRDHAALSLPYAANLVRYLEVNYPAAKLYWHAHSARLHGHPSGTTKDEEANRFAVQIDSSAWISENLDLTRIPCADAWLLAMEKGYPNLTARAGVNSGEGDYVHDGDIGGGQYLNACVWYEVLTHRSCVGNTWRPSYELDYGSFEELQQIAHQTVVALHGENWYID